MDKNCTNCVRLSIDFIVSSNTKHVKDKNSQKLLEKKKEKLTSVLYSSSFSGDIVLPEFSFCEEIFCANDHKVKSVIK